jgi:hypothetical protein
MSSNVPPFDPKQTIQPFPPHGTEPSDIEPGFVRFAPMPTPQSIKDNKLFGIPLRSALTKQTLPDSVIQDAISKAVSEIEHTLKLFISPVTIKRERHNYSWNNFYHAFGYLQTNHRPILEVQKLEVSIPSAFDNENMVEWPTQWLKPYNEHGTIQLVPLTGSGSILITQVSTGVSWPIRLFNADNFPQFWAITYRVGFENDQIPMMIVELIELIAAMRIMSMVGPVAFPYNSYSISLDGLGQSVSSPGPQWFSQRYNDLKEQRDEIMDAARSYYELKWAIDVLG